MYVTLLRRGQIRVDGMLFPLSATTAANGLIGLRDDDDYRGWVSSTWAGLAPPVDQRAWLKQGVPDLLSRAARQAGDDGTLPYRDLAYLLERVRHTSGDQIIVPSLPELAAWALVRAVQAGHHISICGECSNPWLSPKEVEFCYRPAPGMTTTCAQLHASGRFAKHRERWNKEYRRIYARKLRGTVSQDEWTAWLDETRDLRAESVVLTFDDWKRLKQPGEALRLFEELYGPDEAKRISDHLAAEAVSRRRPTPASTDWINALLTLYQRQTEKESTAGASGEHTLRALRR